MKQKLDGESAFPHCHESSQGHPNWRESSGMTLRDYFAVHADQPGVAEILRAAGVEVNKHGSPILEGQPTSFHEWWETIADDQRFALYAKVRYQMADAMLAERAKPREHS